MIRNNMSMVYLYVENISDDASDEKLRKEFKIFGECTFQRTVSYYIL